MSISAWVCFKSEEEWRAIQMRRQSFDMDYQAYTFVSLYNSFLIMNDLRG